MKPALAIGATANEKQTERSRANDSTDEIELCSLWRAGLPRKLARPGLL
jgi:hypothetical protein